MFIGGSETIFRRFIIKFYDKTVEKWILIYMSEHYKAKKDQQTLEKGGIHISPPPEPEGGMKNQ